MRPGGILLAVMLLWGCTSSVESQLDAAATEMRQGNYDNALAIYSKILKKMPDTPAVQNNMGYALLQLGRYDEALPYFEAAYRIAGPEKADVALLHNWANALEKLERYDVAAAKYEEAAKKDPTQAGVYVNWGNTLSRLGKVDEAAMRYQQAVENNPELAIGWFNWGYALERMGRHSEAMDRYRTFLSLGDAAPSNLLEHARRFVAQAESVGIQSDEGQ